MDNARIAALEALLFIHGDPLDEKKIGKILNVPTETIPALLAEYAEILKSEERGLGLVQTGGKAQLVTKPQFGPIAEQFMKEELSEELTPASVEALSLIAYLGPISRPRVDYIRGVNSSFILRSLLLRGLVDRASDPQHSSGFLYAPSAELLKHLGIGRSEELPDYEKFRVLLARFESQGETLPQMESSEPHAE